MSQPRQTLPTWALALAIAVLSLVVGGYVIGRDMAGRDARSEPVSPSTPEAQVAEPAAEPIPTH